MDCPGQMRRGREMGVLLHLLCYYNIQKKNYNIYFKIIKIYFYLIREVDIRHSAWYYDDDQGLCC